MSMQDPLADLLTRIRNAQHIGAMQVQAPSSRLKCALLAVLRREGYIESFKVTEDIKAVLSINLKYFENRPVIQEICRISRPGLRIYRNFRDLPRVKNGYGIAVVSTSRGVISDKQARRWRVGGEILCTVF